VYAPQYVATDDRAGAPASPGMLLKHSSPRAELQLFDGPAERVLARMRQVAGHARGSGRSVGILAPNEEIAQFSGTGAQLAALGPRDDLAAIGQRIFSGMRQLDRRGVDLILVRALAREGIGLAIWDRLLRAAEGRVTYVES
jgi:L-threonylcarbamoyladenylate synthase